jgi:integrase
LILKGTREKVWYVRYLDGVRTDGTRIHRSLRLGTLKDYPTKRLAFRASEIALATVNSPHHKDTPEITFGELAAKWEQMILPQYKPSTQATQKTRLTYMRRLALWHLNDITTETLQTFIASVPSGMVRNVLATLRTIWKVAKSWGYVTHDPFDGLICPRLSQKLPVFYTPEQTRQIITTADEPYRTLFWIVAETGIRGGEACGLKVSDIDFDAGTLTVQQTAWRGRLQSPKTVNAVRCVPLSAELVQHLRLFVDREQDVSLWGKPLDNGNVVKRVLRPITDRLGLAPAGLHALRHGNATMLDRLNAPVAVRLARLGHSRFATSLGYTHVVSEDHRRVAAELGRIFAPSLPQTAGNA